MKNVFIVLTMAITIGLSANCQGLKVPEAVKNAFAAKFPGAANISWGNENAREYEAEFKMNNTAVSANFGLAGSWVETETTIAPTDLPAAVTSAIAVKYPGGKITRAEKLEKPGDKTFYETVIKVNGKSKEVEMNPDGSLVK